VDWNWTRCETPMETIEQNMKSFLDLYIQVQLSRFCFDPLCMMMRFDSAEILNLVIGRERERTLGKQRPSTPFTSHMMNCVNRELGCISSSVDFFVSTWILYNPLQQYFRIIFFLLALLSAAAADDEAGTQKRNSAWSSTPFYSFFQLELF
jgi:hypothetical protein